MRTSFTSVIDLLDHFSEEANCAEYLIWLRWGGEEPTCVHCSGEKLYRLGDGRHFKCASCKKKFSLTKGTIFENSKLPLRKWFAAIYMATSHKKGVSSCQMARDLDVTQKTAWFMLHRVRELFREDSEEARNPLHKEVEADETYIGGKGANKHASKKTEGTQGRSLKEKTPLFGIVERSGELRVTPVRDAKRSTLLPMVRENVEPGATVYTDEYRSYRGLASLYRHSFVRHNDGEYARGEVHTNTIEGFFGEFKRGVFGIYHHVSPEHLSAYTNEYVFRYNTRALGEDQRFVLASVLSKGRRLKYRDLIRTQH
jgi:transposase-like protein